MPCNSILQLLILTLRHNCKYAFHEEELQALFHRKVLFNMHSKHGMVIHNGIYQLTEPQNPHTSTVSVCQMEYPAYKVNTTNIVFKLLIIKSPSPLIKGLFCYILKASILDAPTYAITISVIFQFAVSCLQREIRLINALRQGEVEEILTIICT